MVLCLILLVPVLACCFHATPAFGCNISLEPTSTWKPSSVEKTVWGYVCDGQYPLKPAPRYEIRGSFVSILFSDPTYRDVLANRDVEFLNAKISGKVMIEDQDLKSGIFFVNSHFVDDPLQSAPNGDYVNAGLQIYGTSMTGELQFYQVISDGPIEFKESSTRALTILNSQIASLSVSGSKIKHDVYIGSATLGRGVDPTTLTPTDCYFNTKTGKFDANAQAACAKQIGAATELTADIIGPGGLYIKGSIPSEPQSGGQANEETQSASAPGYGTPNGVPLKQTGSNPGSDMQSLPVINNLSVSYSTIDGPFTISWAHLTGFSLNAESTSLSGPLGIYHSIFDGPATFKDATLSDVATIEDSIFDEGLGFTDSTLQQSVTLGDIKACFGINELGQNENEHNCAIDFRMSSFNGPVSVINLDNVGRFDASNADFSNLVSFERFAPCGAEIYELHLDNRTDNSCPPPPPVIAPVIAASNAAENLAALSPYSDHAKIFLINPMPIAIVMMKRGTVSHALKTFKPVHVTTVFNSSSPDELVRVFNRQNQEALRLLNLDISNLILFEPLEQLDPCGNNYYEIEFALKIPSCSAPPPAGSLEPLRLYFDQAKIVGDLTINQIPIAVLSMDRGTVSGALQIFKPVHLTPFYPIIDHCGVGFAPFPDETLPFVQKISPLLYKPSTFHSGGTCLAPQDPHYKTWPQNLVVWVPGDDANLDLSDTSVGLLSNPTWAWPPPADSNVAGLTYGGLQGYPVGLDDGKYDNTSNTEVGTIYQHDPCLNGKIADWLPNKDDYSPQPYEELAHFYTSVGDATDARCISETSAEISAELGGFFPWLYSNGYYWVARYGYQPLWVIFWVLVLALIGVGIRFNARYRRKREKLRKASLRHGQRFAELCAQWRKSRGKMGRFKKAMEIVREGVDDFFLSLFTLIPGLTPEKDPDERDLGNGPRYYFYVLRILGYALALYGGAALSVQLSK